MIDCVFSPNHRDQLIKILDNFKESALRVLDQGGSVTVHTHHSLKEMVFGPIEVASDFLYTGWSFGLSIGDFPRGGRIRLQQETFASMPHAGTIGTMTKLEPVGIPLEPQPDVIKEA